MQTITYDVKFYETIAIIGHIFENMISFYGFSKRFQNTLEIINFVYFVRAKYYDIFMNFNLSIILNSANNLLNTQSNNKTAYFQLLSEEDNFVYELKQLLYNN